MLKHLEADIDGKQIGGVLRVPDRMATTLKPLLKDGLDAGEFWEAFTTQALRAHLFELGKDPDFYDYHFESERDASVRSWDYVIVAEPRSL